MNTKLYFVNEISRKLEVSYKVKNIFKYFRLDFTKMSKVKKGLSIKEPYPIHAKC